MTHSKTTANGKTKDSEGKIFVSPNSYEEPSMDGFLSLGHRIIGRLSKENADLVVYVSASSF